MFKRQISCLLALVMILQIMTPFNAFARETKPSHTNYAKVGEVSTKGYPKIDTKLILQRNKEVARSRKHAPAQRGVALKKSDYVGGSDPSDSNKPKYFGRVSAKLATKGLDNGPFQWGEIFGTDGTGNNNPIRIEFHQLLNDTPTGVQFSLEVNKDGTYKWQDGEGNPTLLPLYSSDFKPFKYSVFIDKGIAEKVKLITSLSAPTPSTAFKAENGKFVADIEFKIDLQQVAATNFSSVWKTGVAENDRPQMEGNYVITEDGDEIKTPFNFPKNETSRTVIRDGFVENFVADEANEIYALIVDELVNKPKQVEVKTDTAGLAFKDDNGVKTVEKDDHKYKYDFTYDVIKGGKLTMTEILPVTFDANGGTFASITDENAEQKIIKEVDYDGTLTDKAEKPTKDRETFKGWSATKDGKNPITDKDLKNIKEAKTFYAIWDNNAITAEELTVHESYKNGTDYVNDFIPKITDLKKQVKIKDANGDPQALKDKDIFTIVDGSKEYKTDDELKTYLYDKLSEKDNPNDEPTRKETVTAKVTHKNGTSQTVDIPIKVIKNIYEAKTLADRPYYVPTDYVKVIVDPTPKAKDPQKTYYYVNKEAKVVIPGEDPTGTGNYTFAKWLIKGSDTVYELAKKPRHQFSANETTIEAQYVSNIIPAKPDGSKPDNVPTDFVLVEFKAGSAGSLDGTTKYWVNPTAGKELSDITHPNVKANAGWKANGWDKVDTTPITGATEVTAQYLEKVLTKEPENNKDKYVKVEFKQGDHGTIANSETTQYWVLKQEKVSLNGPAVTAKTGYAQKTGDGAWSPEIAEYYYKDTVHTAQYDFNGQDVIPQTGNDKPSTVPEGYVLVEFNQGEHGVIKAGETVKYWVNPKKEVTLPAPTIVPNTGYRQQLRLNAWDKPLTKTFTEATTITAQYKELGDILTEEKPGYVKVEFKAGDHGTLDGTQTYWVNPLKNKTLKDVPHPKVNPSDGWSHNGWDVADNTAINAQTTSPLVVKAQYLEKVLTKTPTANPDKYVTVTFKQGDHGTLVDTDTAKYWVLKNVDVALTAPGVTPATGYAQKAGDEAWSPKQMSKYSENTEHVAQYVYTGNDVVPAGPNGSKPDGTPDNFVLVTFDKGDHGESISGQTQYWVNPDKEVTLTAPSVTANRGYEQKPDFNAWDHYLTATFKQPTTIKAQYNELGDILTEEKPGYVKVEFKRGDHGSLDGTTVYYVNPDANKKLSDVRHPNVKAEDHWKHVGWDVAEDTTISATTNPLVVTAKYLKDVLTTDPQDATNYVKVTFDQGAHGSIAADATKAYWVLKNTEVTLAPPTVTADTAKGYKQKEGKDAWSPEIAKAYSQDTTHVAQYEYQGQDVIPQKGTEKPSNVPDDFVKVTFKPTAKAETDADKIFWVKANKEVTIPVTKPEGKHVAVGEDNNTQAFKWEFTKWVSTEQATRTWDKNIDTGVTAMFTAKETVINAEYKKVITDQGTVMANEITVHESFKDGDNWVNNFIEKEATEAILKAAIKRTGANGQPEGLPTDATVTLLNDKGQPFANDEAFKTALYGKLKEKDDADGKPSRIEKLKAQVKFANNEVQNVEIPIKVIKNIYEAKTGTKAPDYVPDSYVKVAVVPTTKATDPQKYTYFVNPKANVVIPGKDPTGIGDNKFVKWTMKADTATGDGAEYALADKPRHMFTEASTITAQYVSDVIPQEGTTKPDTVPSNFVEVKFVPTDNGTMEGPKTFWVNPNKEVTIPVKDPVGKQYFTFKEWKMGEQADGAVYKPSEAKKFEQATTITATYTEAETIIPYDPKEPKTKPAGYVRVSFEADKGLSLSDVKHYYVKENAGIKLGDSGLTKPTVTADIGYKFDKWNKDDTTEITNVDVVVTAKATKRDNVIPATNDQGQPNEKPEGYKEVTFVIKTEDKDKGSITSVAKFYVNPNEYVTITPPSTKAETGFEFGAWDKDATIPKVYKEDTTITGSFNGLKDVIPKTNPDGTENKQPDGYFTITFKLQGEGQQASFVEGETTVYYVDPNRKVSLQPPKYKLKTGWKFTEWDFDTTTEHQYSGDKTIYGNVRPIPAIIPEKDENNQKNPKPDGYVTVTFKQGDSGKFTNATDVKVFYVNPDAKQKLSDIKPKPSVTPDVGYKYLFWNKLNDPEIDQDLTVTAVYKKLDDVVPKENPKGGENKQPDGYIAVKFSTETNGKINGTDKTEKVVYVNPNKAVALDKFAPEVVPNTGFDFAGWDTQIVKKIQYSDGDTIKALYNAKDDVIPQGKPDGSDKPAGYLTVTFAKGDHGDLSGQTVYYVKPNKKVTVPAPDVKPSVGYEFDKWDKALTQTFTKDTTITAGYKPLDNIIPQKNTDGSDKPNGYVAVTFKAVNGTLSGTTTYYVNGEKEVDLTDTAKAITKKANVGFTDEGGTWTPAIESKKYTKDETYTFAFKPLPAVIKKIDENTKKPDGYVTVKLIPTDKATDTTEKIYFVNPTKEVTITNKPEGKKETKDGIEYTYHFKGWTVTKGIVASWTDENINSTFKQETDITAKYTTKVDAGELIPAPVPKKDTVTPKGDVPDASTLIENKDKLPANTTIGYAKGGKPSVDKAGNVTAKVEVKYPNGKTAIVEVPITVVDHVVPQDGGEGGKKPLVPDSYVKVTVDTKDKATDNTMFKKVFWVKPNVNVTIPGIKNPTGKAEKGADSITRTYNFDKWQREDDPAKVYGKEIKDIFTGETKIVATYTVEDNVLPQGKDNPWIPQNSDPSPKDFIKNPYDDNDPNNKDNLPPGTKLEFVPGKKPNTDQPGSGETTIKVIYPNGETKEVPVKYRVTGDVVEQTDPMKKPDVPNDFVEVIVKTTDNATDETFFEKKFWVNPKKIVTIGVPNPTGKDLNVKKYEFTGWDHPLRDQFTAPTTITAQYSEIPYNPSVTTDLVETQIGKQPTMKDYAKQIHVPDGSFDVLGIEEKPDVSSKGMKTAKVKIKIKSGGKTTTKDVYVRVYVVPDPKIIEKPVPGDCNNGCDQPNVGKGALNTTDHYQYLIGYPDGNFAPNKGMTRAEVATMFTRLLKERPVKWKHYNAGLSDIHAGDWYANTVGYAVQKGIVSGYPDGSFKPNKPITRAEFASIASRFDALAQGDAIAFSDLAPSHWGYKAIRSAASKGWISGYPDNTFRPEQAITRAEVTSVTNRMLNRYADLYWIDAHRAEVIRFGDVKRSDWYFEPIMEATMGHDFIRDRDGKTEHWSGVNGKSFI